MRVILLYNPRSGRGRSVEVVARLCDALSMADTEVDALEVGSGLSPFELAQRARGAAALVVAGGDGSVQYAATSAIEADVPIYHYPMGTENLFAREFGSKASAESLIAALARNRTTTADVAVCNGRLFLLMASVGFDAHVVERVAAARTAGVRRSDYLRHALHEFAHLRLPPLTITADGRPVASAEPGLVIIANSRQYAARLNPCADARIDDRLLEVLFLPYRSAARLAAWAASISLGMHMHAHEARTDRAQSIVIRSPATNVPHQLDGESVVAAPGPLAMEIHVEPRRLRVLLPAD